MIKRTLPEKVNRILNVLLIILILIAVRLWHLAGVEHNKKIQQAKNPQIHTVYERAERATIEDCFGIPLAINQIQYNAAVNYAEISQLPRWVWKRDENNKRCKFFLRKEHITKLASLLAGLLNLDPEWIEDTIHSKAAVLGAVPCVIKENITEEQYFRLKMLEGNFPGVCAEHVAKRCYPQGRVASEVIGYLGAISQSKYELLTRELKELRQVIALYEEQGPSYGFMNTHSLQEAKKRLKELEDQAYRITDLVGKAGVEATFDQQLRGCRGKKVYLTDRKGNFLREIQEGNPPEPGKRLRLSISSELQLYAEQLLAGFENRELIAKLEKNVAVQFPWIKGGAIVAVKPDNGEVVALASYPRFDPNDFIKSGEYLIDCDRQKQRMKWLENSAYIEGIWDQDYSLERERFDETKGLFYEESLTIDWPTFLHFLVSEDSPILKNFQYFSTIEDSFIVQKLVEKILLLFASDEISLTAAKIFNALFEGGSHIAISTRETLNEQSFIQERKEKHKESLEQLLTKLSPYFSRLPYNGDKLLYTDLCRLVVHSDSYTRPLLQEVGKKSLADERRAQVAKVQVEKALKEISKSLFDEYYFKKWRQDHFKAFLDEQRLIEKEEKRWPKPYLEYLLAQKGSQFEEFWKQNKNRLLLLFLTGRGNDKDQFEHQLMLWAEELLQGAHGAYPWTKQYHYLKEILATIDVSQWESYLNSMRACSELTRPLLGSYSYLHGSTNKIEKDLAMAFYPKYGFGYMRSHAFRQATTAGSVFKVVCSYEVLKQRYLQLQGKNANFANLNPLQIIDDKHRSESAPGKWNVGYTLEGKPIPLYYKGGRLPRSEHAHIGKVDLLRALETSSNPYFSLVAGGCLEDPEDLCHAASLFGYGHKTGIELPGEYAGHIPDDVAYNRTGLYSFAIGQHSLAITPLQTAVMMASLANGGQLLMPQILKGEKQREVKWHIFMPEEIHHLLIMGLKRVVSGEKGTARALRTQFPADMIANFIGKTSTAEEMEKVRFDGMQTIDKVQHISFASIFYDPNYPPLTKPELVVIVYLRHGRYGRLAAPLAAKVVQKWQQLKEAHSRITH